jgi:hypothetical protein
MPKVGTGNAAAASTHSRAVESRHHLDPRFRVPIDRMMLANALSLDALEQPLATYCEDGTITEADDSQSDEFPNVQNGRASDLTPYIYPPHFSQLLGLDGRSIDSWRGREAADVGSRLCYVRFALELTKRFKADW